MSADTLIRKALDAGIELQFVGGQLKATGRRSAVAAWAPTLREHRARLIAALQPPAAPAAAPPIDWQPLAQAYHTHHFACPTCSAAGRGYGLRCGTGTALWAAYSDATEPKDTP